MESEGLAHETFSLQIRPGSSLGQMRPIQKVVLAIYVPNQQISIMREISFCKEAEPQKRAKKWNASSQKSH
jgi:hypothetical protein